MSEFLAMGGHAAYVWTAYGITLVVLGGSAWAAVRRHRMALMAARQQESTGSPRRTPRVTRI